MADPHLPVDHVAEAPGPEPVRRRAFLGLGSNLGERLELLRGAIASLPDLVAVSSVFETEPVGGPGGQGPYLNAVAELWTAASPRALLALARDLESAAGRRRDVRWGARTLDVDVLLVGDLVVDEDDLVVPHPRIAERRFVCAPLAELAPELLPAGWEERAAGRVHRLGSLHDLDRESEAGVLSERDLPRDRGHRTGPGSGGVGAGASAEETDKCRATPPGSGCAGELGEERVVVDPVGGR